MGEKTRYVLTGFILWFFFFPVPVVETLGIFNCFQCFRHTKKCILKS